MNSARLRLSADTTKIFFRDGWLIIEVADPSTFKDELARSEGEQLLTVAEVSKQTGFTPGAVRDWIKREVLPAKKVGKQYRVRESDLSDLLNGKPTPANPSPEIGRRRRKAVVV